jgi:hypothetical protein
MKVPLARRPLGLCDGVRCLDQDAYLFLTHYPIRARAMNIVRSVAIPSGNGSGHKHQTTEAAAIGEFTKSAGANAPGAAVDRQRMVRALTRT